MKLTILGSGTSIIKKDRLAPGYLIELNSGESFLFDCGGTVAQRFADIKFDYTKLDHILISHPHADHMSGLIFLLHSIYLHTIYSPHAPDVFLKRAKPLFLHGYPGFYKDYQILRKMMFWEQEEPYQIKIIEYGDTQRKFSGFTIETKLVPHNEKQYEKYNKGKNIGFRLEAEGKSFVYSGDTAYCQQLIDLARNADLALFECSSLEKGLSGEVHITPEGAGKVVQEARVKKLVLTHHHDLRSKEQILKEAKKYFSREIVMAKDLMEIKI